MAQQMYDDVYLRTNLQDTGLYPATGVWTDSPDIIPNGTTLIHDPIKTLTDSYSKDVGKETVLNQQNYFYIRAKNLFEGPTEAQFMLYYCPQNIFLFPKLWRDNILLTSDGKTQVTAKADKKGDILVPIEPLTNLPISTVHHCMIGRVITSRHPNPLPPQSEVKDMASLGKYMLGNPAMAWRNIVLVQKDIPTFTHYFDLDTGEDEGKVLMGLNCRGLTVGSSVAFSCGTPIPSGPDKGKLIELVKTPVKQPDIFIGQMTLDLPKNFKTNVSYSYWANPPIESDWEVEFQAYFIPQKDSELYELATPIAELGLSLKGFEDFDGLPKALKIGGCATQPE